MSSRPAIRFDAAYHERSNSGGRLQVINRGTETAYDIRLSVPEDAGLELHGDDKIEKIPGGGKSVTLNVFNTGRYLGGRATRSAFDLTFIARTESGEEVTQEVFLDMKGY